MSFSKAEHERFVEGLELAKSEDVWCEIGRHVGRTAEEVKAHAQYYLMSLQTRNADVTLSAMAGNWVKAWSPSENEIFENALASFDEGDDRWEKIATLLPGKSAADVRLWYERLLGDMLDIERGAK